MRDLLLWGATGQARVIAEFAARAGYRIVALIDNNPAVASPLPAIACHHGLAGFKAYLASRAGQGPAAPLSGVATMGGWRGRDRIEINAMLAARGLAIPTLVHPAAIVAGTVAMGAGCQILARAVLCADARLGAAVIVNTAASVDHECRLGDGVHIAPGATLAGCVEVGDRSFIGPGAVVVSRARIGADVIIGAGAVVTRDIPDGVVAYGSPARVVRKSDLN